MHDTLLFYLELGIKAIIFIQIFWLLAGIGRYVQALTERVKLKNTLSVAATTVNGMRVIGGRRESDLTFTKLDSAVLMHTTEKRKE